MAMPVLPTRRLLVYVAVGLVVLVVGTLGIVSMRGGVTGAAEGVTIIPADSATNPGGSMNLPDRANPGVSWPTTETTEAQPIYVQVAGAVRRPGVYQVAAEARVFQAVQEAGGFTEDADQQAVALAARVTDGCRVYVPRVGEPVADAAAIPEQTGAGPAISTSRPVSLNTATLEELDSLPGVGPATAQDIIAYREAEGPFTSIDQLNEVPGIGPAKLEKLRPFVGL